MSKKKCTECFSFCYIQELNKKHTQLEQAHAMLLKHHEKTQELEYKQQKSVHTLREEQINKQHATELQNQKDYMDRAEKELLRKHAVELKQQPKSLKVYHLEIEVYLCCIRIKSHFSTVIIAKGIANT